MPQYELMYLLGSQVADTDVPAITQQIQKFVSDFGGKNIVETQLGKKKLAYPIGKTRNGHYVVVNFAMETKSINEFDAKIRTQDNTIIRYLMINTDEHLKRLEKDKVQQAKLSHRDQTEEAAAAPSPAAPTHKTQESAKAEKSPEPLVEINQEELDKKIEAALSEDITK
jgi:small subunit ribosomal protein S6